MCWPRVLLIVVLLLSSDQVAAAPEKRVVKVDNVSELHQAVKQAKPHTKILIAKGEYLLSHSLAVGVRHVELRGATGRRADVVLKGTGMSERKVGVAISVNVSDVTVADLTIRDVGFHGVQVRGEQGVKNAVLSNLHILDTGQQHVKGSSAFDGRFSEDCIVQSSLFEYSDHAPSGYANGVDVLGGKRWIVRGNIFRRIRGPRKDGWRCGPTILFWGVCYDTIVERNVLLDCYRGIALGLAPKPFHRAPPARPYFDHVRGAIRNNVVWNLNSWANEGIEVNAGHDVRIEHNTVYVQGKIPWSIGVRFPSCTALVRNNLSNQEIRLRDRAQALQAHNVTSAKAEWFLNAEKANLRLRRAAVVAIDEGMTIPDVQFDLLRRPRTIGGAADIGAFEFEPPRDKK